jgi:hypothetical protein
MFETEQRFRPKEHDWLPEWDQEDQYPNADKMDLEDWAWEFLRRNRKYQKNWEMARKNPSLKNKFAEHWGLIELASPVFSRECNFLLNFTTSPRPRFSGQKLAGGSFVWKLGASTEKSECGFIVDLSAPVEPQVQFIRRHMESAQKQLADKNEYLFVTRAHPKNFKNYLRCFDADQRGVVPKTIARVLNVTRQKVVNDLKRAKDLVEGQYGKIPMHIKPTK